MARARFIAPDVSKRDAFEICEGSFAYFTTPIDYYE